MTTQIFNLIFCRSKITQQLRQLNRIVNINHKKQTAYQIPCSTKVTIKMQIANEKPFVWPNLSSNFPETSATKANIGINR